MVNFAMARMYSDPCKTFGGHDESRFVKEVVFGLRLPDVGPTPSQGMCCYSSYVISAKQHIDLAPIKGRTDACLVRHSQRRNIQRGCVCRHGMDLALCKCRAAILRSAAYSKDSHRCGADCCRSG